MEVPAQDGLVLLTRAQGTEAVKVYRALWTLGGKNLWLNRWLPWPEARDVEKNVIELEALGWSRCDAVILAVSSSKTIAPGEAWPFTKRELAWVSPPQESLEPSVSFLPLKSEELGFYAIVDRADWLERLALSGVKIFQLRIKDLSGPALADELARGVSTARSLGLYLWVNDYWKIAVELGAWGVHLGQEDIENADLVAIASAGVRLGVSTHCLFEVARAVGIEPSYIACGPIFPTTLKAMNFAPQGLGALSRWKAVLDTPLVAIGGITLSDLGPVLASGVEGVAAVSAVTQAADPAQAARRFVEGVATFRKTGCFRPQDETLSASEVVRYRPHLLLPSVGAEGQKKLKNARVLCIGAGGLGSPLLLYLAAAGVGTLGIIDDDRVEVSNLQRQILYNSADVNQLKARVARTRLEAINPHVRVVDLTDRLVPENAQAICKDYDLVADGSDNFATRYLVNHACRALGLPLVSASVRDFQGQCAVFVPEGSCYNCLFPANQGESGLGTCRDRGILGVLAGVMGTIQATEVVKLLLGVGESLKSRLLVLDVLTWDLKIFHLPRDPQCSICSSTVSQPFSYHDALCQSSFEVSVAQTLSWLESGLIELLDVRTDEERALFHIGGKHLPLARLEAEAETLAFDKSYVVYCSLGQRSRVAVQILRAKGVQAWSLEGGIAKEKGFDTSADNSGNQG
jgi:adenylyltransferase/sulfurtransferase